MDPMGAGKRVWCGGGQGWAAWGDISCFVVLLRKGVGKEISLAGNPLGKKGIGVFSGKEDH